MPDPQRDWQQRGVYPGTHPDDRFIRRHPMLGILITPGAYQLYVAGTEALERRRHRQAADADRARRDATAPTVRPDGWQEAGSIAVFDVNNVDAQGNVALLMFPGARGPAGWPLAPLLPNGGSPVVTAFGNVFFDSNQRSIRVADDPLTPVALAERSLDGEVVTSEIRNLQSWETSWRDVIPGDLSSEYTPRAVDAAPWLDPDADVTDINEASHDWVRKDSEGGIWNRLHLAGAYSDGFETHVLWADADNQPRGWETVPQLIDAFSSERWAFAGTFNQSKYDGIDPADVDASLPDIILAEQSIMVDGAAMPRVAGGHRHAVDESKVRHFSQPRSLNALATSVDAAEKYPVVATEWHDERKAEAFVWQGNPLAATSEAVLLNVVGDEFPVDGQRPRVFVGTAPQAADVAQTHLKEMQVLGNSPNETLVAARWESVNPEIRSVTTSVLTQLESGRPIPVPHIESMYSPVPPPVPAAGSLAVNGVPTEVDVLRPIGTLGHAGRTLVLWGVDDGAGGLTPRGWERIIPGDLHTAFATPHIQPRGVQGFMRQGADGFSEVRGFDPAPEAAKFAQALTLEAAKGVSAPGRRTRQAPTPGGVPGVGG